MEIWFILIMLVALWSLVAPLDTSSRLSTMQRPRKPHRYKKQQNFKSKIDASTNSLANQSVAPINVERQTDDHFELKAVSNRHENSGSSSTSADYPQQFFKAMGVLMALQWKSHIGNIVMEMEKLLRAIAKYSRDLIKANEQHKKRLELLRKLYLLLKIKHKSQNNPVGGSVDKSTDRPPIVENIMHKILQNDIQTIASKQSEYVQTLEEKLKEREMANKIYNSENKELRCTLYRTEVALRESNHEKDQLESKVSLLTMEQQQDYQYKEKGQHKTPIRAEYDVSTIHNINTCILIASRAQKYETYTDEVIARLEGQLRNVSMQLSRYHMSYATTTDNTAKNC